MFDHSQGAERALARLMREEVERQFSRLGEGAAWTRFVSVASPGVLAVSTPSAGREVSFFGAAEVLAALPNRAGLRAGVDALLGDGARLRPHPRNEPDTLRPGDTVLTVPDGHGRRSGKVLRILAGGMETPSYGTGSGDPHPADVTVEVARKGAPPWAIPVWSLSDRPGPRGARRDVPHLRRLHDQAGRLLHDEVAAIVRGKGWDERLLGLVACKAAMERVLQERTMQSGGPARDGVAFLRLHRRAVERVRDRILAPATHTVDEAGLAHMLRERMDEIGLAVRYAGMALRREKADRRAPRP